MLVYQDKKSISVAFVVPRDFKLIKILFIIDVINKYVHFILRVNVWQNVTKGVKKIEKSADVVYGRPHRKNINLVCTCICSCSTWLCCRCCRAAGPSWTWSSARSWRRGTRARCATHMDVQRRRRRQRECRAWQQHSDLDLPHICRIKSFCYYVFNTQWFIYWLWNGD